MSSYKKRMILEAPETTAGTAASIAAANAILALNVTLRNLEADYQTQDFVTGQEGAQSDDVFNTHAGAEFSVEAIPAPSAGAAPIYASLLKSSGLSETIDAGTSVAYSPTPQDDDYASNTMMIRNGKVMQTIVGTRGSMSFTAEVNRRALFTFNRRGSYASPVEPTAMSGDFTDWDRALICSPEFMNAFTLGGTKLCVRSFSFTDGREPIVDKYMNCGGTDITGRSFTGRAQVKWPDIATKDILTNTRDVVIEPLVFELGKTAGKKLRITAPRVQIKFAGEENIDNDLGASLDLKFLPDQGDDEILIEFL